MTDAVPDVPPTEDCRLCGRPVGEHVPRLACPSDVPPDPPAATRDELARVLDEHSWLAEEDATCACGWKSSNWDSPDIDEETPALNQAVDEFTAHQVDALAGVLVATADVRAQALEDAAGVRARVLRWAASFGTMPGKSWPETLRYHADYIDRAVSEREGTSDG